MDDRRFDDLTKLVGRRASRRAVIKAALAGALASVFGSSIAEAALSPIKTRPRLCIQPSQTCGRPGVDPSRDCCYKCNHNTNKCCEDIGYLCTRDSDCCVKVVGGQNVQPICRDPNTKDTDRRKACYLPGTLTVGAQCIQGSDCASGNCAGGVCQQCPTGSTTCGANCCDIKRCQVCSAGVCNSKCGPCQLCDGNGICSSTCTTCQTCTNGVCKAKVCGPCQTCNQDTGLCQSSCDSCQICKNNVCVARCNACQTCNPATGGCADTPCASKCDVCNPTTGVCSSKACGPCQTCDPADGICKSTCSACQACRNGVCVDTCPSCQVCTDGSCTPTSCANLCETCNLTTGVCESVDCGVCNACDPATGQCLRGCAECQICESGVCVDNCSLDDCLQCDVESGLCVDSCGPCEICNSGVCETNCLACQVCDAYVGLCVDACEPCSSCDPDTQQCVPNTCSVNTDCCGGACTCGSNDEAGHCQQPFFQGFETDTSGWSAPITRVASGTDGIASKSGGFHAEVGQDASGSAFTRLGGYSNVFPAGGFTVSVDIYLDPSDASLTNDMRFDWSAAISTPGCGFIRDFVFNAGFYNDSDPAHLPGTGNRFIISGSNNAGRSQADPFNPGNSPIAITTSGWYTFKHVFSNQAGVLVGDLSIIDSSDNTVFTWTLSDPSDIIGSTVGGNRYGWFVIQELPFLAIDNSSRT